MDIITTEFFTAKTNLFKGKRLADGSRHDIKDAENLLRGCIGTAIGDKCHSSSQVRNRLKQVGLRFITPARTKNRNTEKGKGLLRKRNLVKYGIGKFVEDGFSRFRAWQAVQATIAIDILMLNLEVLVLQLARILLFFLRNH
ncbi:MAG: hypothetical protein LBB26_04555 [Puniceicoccales bacterium]|jgi:hypothetical protein|nr:hypothetical protein [Puniceicoccales bacterium]